MRDQDFELLVCKDEYHFFDFGCSTGECIDYAYQTFNNPGTGLGIDISEKKIEMAREKGHAAIAFDILKIPDRKLVEFVTMSHFLEHLPSVKIADQFLRKAVVVAKQYVFIRQPFFDADGYLAQHGLKLYWSDWTGHPNKMTSLDFYLSLKKMKSEGLLSGFSINFVSKIPSSTHYVIHPLNSPIDQHWYDPAIHHHKKNDISLDNVFREIVVLVHVDKVEHSRFEMLSLDKEMISVE